MAKLYLKKNVTLCYVYSLFCNLTLHHPIHLGPHYLVTMEFLIAVNLLNAIKSNPGMIKFPASTSLIFLFIDTHTVNFYFSCETQTFIEHILSANICVCANVQIAKFRLKLKKVGKTTRPFRYDLNQIPYDYTVEVLGEAISSLDVRIYERLDLVGVADAGDTEGCLEGCICIKNFGASWPSIHWEGSPILRSGTQNQTGPGRVWAQLVSTTLILLRPGHPESHVDCQCRGRCATGKTPKSHPWSFPGGPVVKNSPSDAGA